MHRLQQRILHQLLLHKNCRYRDIKPKEVEGNLFMYHLKQLITDELVEKTDNRYQLTQKGLKFVDTLSLKNLKPRIQPKIITLLAVKNNSGKWLLYKRSRQPMFGKIGFPYGKIHLGEKIKEAAERELLEKTGIEAKLNHKGDVYITTNSSNDLVSHVLLHIFTGKNPKGALLKESDIGKCYWGSIKDIPEENIFLGLEDILKLIKTKNHFFEELTYNIDN